MAVESWPVSWFFCKLLGQFANFKRAGFLKQAMEPGMPTGRGIKGSQEGFPLLRIENKAASISQGFVRTG
jgi:hypothetical protein